LTRSVEPTRARYRWVILAAGTLAQTSFTTISVGLPALAPALQAHYRLSLGEVGVVLGAVGIGMLLTLLPWGLLADRLGERAVIAIGLAGAGVATAAAGLTDSYGELVLALAVAGALGASVNAASGRAVMAWFDARERGFALGIRQTAIPVGGAAAAIALPWLASAGGTDTAFFALGATCIAGAIVATLLLRESPDAGVSPAELAAPLRDVRMWLLAVGSTLYLVAQLAITVFVVLFLHEHRGLSTHAAAAVLAAINVLGIGSRIGAGFLSDRMQARLRPLRYIGAALTVATAVVALLVDAPLAVLVPALMIAGVLSISWNGLSFTAAAELAGRARSGAALGLQQTALGVLSAGFPPAFAAIVEATSWRTAFALSALGPALGLVTLWRVPEPSAANSDARRRETSAIPPAAR
jgi:sugar phosphate permease